MNSSSTIIQKQRLAILEEFGLSGTEQQRELEDYLELTRTLCDVSVVYISLTIKKKEYLAFQLGEEFSAKSLEDLPYNIPQEKAPSSIIEDVNTRQLDTDKPPNTLPFFKKFSLTSNEGELIGALCIADCEYKELTTKEWHGIHVLGKKIAQFITQCKGLSDFQAEKSKNLNSINTLIIRNLYKAMLLKNQKMKEQNRRIEKVNQLLSQKEKELTLITNSIPACISFVDRQYCYQMNNKTYFDWFGYSKDELKGRHIRETHGEEGFKQTKERLDKVFQGSTIKYENNAYFKDGQERFTRVTILPSVDDSGEIIGAYVFAEDISKLKKIQQKLKASNEELQRFAGTVSHDLKAPLRRMSSFCQLLKRRYREQLDKDGREFLDFISQSAKQSSELIQDLLSYAVAGEVELEEVPTISLSSVIDAVLNNLGMAIEEKKAVVTISDHLPKVKVLFHDAVQLFQNLICNGIKYNRNEAGPKIDISTQLQNEFILITIKDNGIGIQKEQLEKIFQPFYRCHNTKEYQGTGIGLATCQKIVQKYDCKLWVESEVGKGSTFYFTLLVE